MSEHLITTVATYSTCGKCNLSVMVGVDLGLSVKVDVAEIEPAHEWQVLVNGLRTYTKISTGHLIYRIAAHISSGEPKGPIHAEHRCEPNFSINSDLDAMAAARAQRWAVRNQQRRDVRAHLIRARVEGKAARHSTRLHTRSSS